MAGMSDASRPCEPMISISRPATRAIGTTGGSPPRGSPTWTRCCVVSLTPTLTLPLPLPLPRTLTLTLTSDLDHASASARAPHSIFACGLEAGGVDRKLRTDASGQLEHLPSACARARACARAFARARACAWACALCWCVHAGSPGRARAPSLATRRPPRWRPARWPCLARRRSCPPR